MSSVVVLINGASASGKSHLVAGVQRIAAETGVLRGTLVAPLTTTKPVHGAYAKPIESGTLDPEEFHAAVCSGALDVHWRGMMENDIQKRYGFALAQELAAGEVVILCANNYLNWTSVPLLMGLRAERRLMVVRVHASLNTRLARLRALSPRPQGPELAQRLLDLPNQLLPQADHVILNEPPLEQTAEWDLLSLITSFRFASLPTGGKRSRELTLLGQRVSGEPESRLTVQ